MTSLLRQIGLITVSALVSWWLFIGLPDGATSIPEPRIESADELTLDLTPFLEPFAAEEDTETARVEAEPQPAPPDVATTSAPDPADSDEIDVAPSEAGSPEGESDDGAIEVAEDAPAEQDQSVAAATEKEASTRIPADTLRRDTELLEAAAAEFSGEARRGFQTVLVASPADQLDIAHAFGEEVVLVPKNAIDPDAKSPDYFRLRSDGSVELVKGRPELTSFRQYRDLFDYEYARLPEPVRALRRSVLARGEVYLFAALIPLDEWAIVIGRRREALAQSGRELSEVKSFTLRYLRSSDRTFDLAVDEIRFKGGERFRPAELERKGG